jgi:2-hydroxychromene-2-carboxylate isomerase
MHTGILIERIVRQTTVLIAQLSTAAGIRAPLAHIADQVFVELSREIESQGVARKVVADMFGLALRTYQRKVQRLTESATQRSSTLWEAVLEYVRKNDDITRARLAQRFARDDPEQLAAVIADLGAG